MRIIARSTTSKYLNLVSIFLTFVKLKHNFSSQFYFLMIWHNMAELNSSIKKPPKFTVVLPQMRCTMKKTYIMIRLIIFLAVERCTYLIVIFCVETFSGAPTYMSPEGFQSQEITILSDLWSLGCVLYEMFTG